jgi:hypothetical protein
MRIISEPEFSFGFVASSNASMLSQYLPRTPGVILDDPLDGINFSY